MLTLEIAGALEPFAPVFALSIYASERTRYMGQVLAKGDVFAVEVAERTGFRFPKAAVVQRSLGAVNGRRASFARLLVTSSTAFEDIGN